MKSGNSSYSDDESVLESQSLDLENKLILYPYHYEYHIQYIETLQNLVCIEKLGAARKNMHKHFLLPPKIWREWARDETSKTLGGIHTPNKRDLNDDSRNKAVGVIAELYDLGVHQYLSVSLWCAYIRFLRDYDSSVIQFLPNGILKMRALFQICIATAGLHVSKGSVIWKAYTKFETEVLAKMDKNDVEGRGNQSQLLENIYESWLAVPLKDIETTFAEYRTLVKGSIRPSVQLIYEQSLSIYDARTFYEERICRKDASLQSFTDYLKFEQSSGIDSSRVIILYERAVRKFPYKADLWLEYTNYLDTCDCDSSFVYCAYQRATRNCYLSSLLWIQFLLFMERKCFNANDVSEVFEDALRCCSHSFDEHSMVCLAQIDVLRRKFYKPEDKINALDSIRSLFKRATDFVPKNEEISNQLLHTYARWAHLEWHLGNNMLAAREVWKGFITIRGPALEAVKKYIKFEILTGNLDEARQLYKKYYCRLTGAYSETLCKSWIQFESEHGSKEDYTDAVEKVAIQKKKLQLVQKDPFTAFLYNLSLQVKKKDLSSFFRVIGGVTDIRISKEFNANTERLMGVAFVDFSDREHIDAALKMQGQLLLQNPLNIEYA